MGGKLAIPEFGGDREPGWTDFNDLAVQCGPEAIRAALAKATLPDDDAPGGTVAGWPHPQALTAKLESEPYPLDALPDTLRAAVEEVAAFVKAPLPLVASSALASLSLAAQAHVDVIRAEKLQGPSGLFPLIIADSGERKSTCDGFFMAAVRDHEAREAEAAKPELKDHKADIDAWECKRAAIKDKIRQLTKDDKPTERRESALRELEHRKPEPPRVPRLVYADTPRRRWSMGWPSNGRVPA